MTDDNGALLTDLYELTMAASYFSHGMTEPATFDLFVRRLPEQRRFLISCGLDQALGYLERLRFDREAIDYLDSLGMFTDAFLAFLGNLRFTGEVSAVREGEAVFEGEPLLQITAPMIEGQIVETFLLNCVTFQTMVASKAARVSIAARGHRFVDYSLRRDHGADAGLKAARASFVGGASATSNVLAGKAFGIPVTGTMAHSYIMAFEDEVEAFRAFLTDFPRNAVVLIDTFDVEEGARNAVQVAKELAGSGVVLRGVRIDSGDLATLTRAVRKILDDGGLEHVQIFLSGDLDEHKVANLLDEGVPVHAFGVGTQMGTSGDAPALATAYKLVEDVRGPKIKLSTGKATLPGRKQIFRVSKDGYYDHDVIGLEGESLRGRPLLDVVMENGRRAGPLESLEDIRDRCRGTLECLPPSLCSLEPGGDPYRVGLSDELKRLTSRMQAELK